MKFYRMMNGDIATGLQLVMSTNALKGICVYDSNNTRYCFTPRVYHDGVKERLATAPKTVLQNQLNTLLSKQEVHLPHVTNWKKLREWKGAIKEAIHDYTK